MLRMFGLGIFYEVLLGNTSTLDRAGRFYKSLLISRPRHFLHGLFIVEDKLSMAHSLETRLPFMDNDLVDFAMQCPVNTKLKISKRLLN